MKQLTRNIIAITVFILGINPCSAGLWENLWSRADEQAMKLLQTGKAKQAAKQFVDPEWQSIAQYRAGDYKQATATLKPFNSARSQYNQGNALAHLGQYEEAISSYDKSLKLDPKNEDATFNRDLLKKLLQQQQKQQNQQNKSQRSSNEKNKDQQKSPQENKQTNNKEQQQDQNNSSKQEKEKPQQTPQQQKQQAKQHEQENEKNQEAKQWLSRIPEDPGGLLREKFLRDYQRRQESSVNAN